MHPYWTPIGNHLWCLYCTRMYFTTKLLVKHAIYCMHLTTYIKYHWCGQNPEVTSSTASSWRQLSIGNPYVTISWTMRTVSPQRSPQNWCYFNANNTCKCPFKARFWLYLSKQWTDSNYKKSIGKVVKFSIHKAIFHSWTRKKLHVDHYF